MPIVHDQDTEQSNAVTAIERFDLARMQMNMAKLDGDILTLQEQVTQLCNSVNLLIQRIDNSHKSKKKKGKGKKK